MNVNQTKSSSVFRGFLGFPVNEPDNGTGASGGAGAAGGSLVDNAAIEAAAAAAAASGADAAGGAAGDDLGKVDPFGDLKVYQDAENGLYLSKYKNLKDVFEGYKSQSAKLREKFPEAPAKPEDYAFKFDKESGLEGHELTIADPVWGAMAPVFHAAGVSQEQAHKVVAAYIKHQQSQLPDVAAEKQKLGAEADTIIADVNQFVGRHNNPALTKLAIQAGQNAETLKAFHQLVKGGGARDIPAKVGEDVAAKTASEWDAEARAFKETHKNSIDSNPAQQKQYYALLSNAQKAKARQA